MHELPCASPEGEHDQHNAARPFSPRPCSALSYPQAISQVAARRPFGPLHPRSPFTYLNSRVQCPPRRAQAAQGPRCARSRRVASLEPSVDACLAAVQSRIRARIRTRGSHRGAPGGICACSRRPLIRQAWAPRCRACCSGLAWGGDATGRARCMRRPAQEAGCPASDVRSRCCRTPGPGPPMVWRGSGCGSARRRSAGLTPG